MKASYAVCLSLGLVCSFMVRADRVVTSYNDGWEFSRDQKFWQAVDIPHDWAIAGPFLKALTYGDDGKLPWKGVGYYRKQLILDKVDRNRRTFLDFDGVMCDGIVYVNKQPCAHQPYGYLGMRADITTYLEEGTNTILVKADTTKLRSRWYPGAGIYRRVRMIETDGIYLDDRKVQVMTPHVDAERAEIVVCGKVTNWRKADERVTVKVRVLSPAGVEVASTATQVTVPDHEDGAFEVKLTVKKPELWRMVNPAKLYTTEISLEGAARDRLAIRTGLRYFRFDAKEGFFLNGENVRLHGVCLHSDLGILGMAFNRSAMKRQLLVMRDMGVNALRTSHNPPAPELLDLCDEMGIFVWDECYDKWNYTIGRKDEPLDEYVADGLRQFVRRDRNHASVFVWSIGNEIPARGGFAPGQEIWSMPAALGTNPERCAYLRRVVRELDKTRPVGIGSCDIKAPGYGDYASLDITGWNYTRGYMNMHRLYPEKPLVYTESASAFSEYGYYAPQMVTNINNYALKDLAIDSYDLNCATWAEIADLDNELMMRDRFVAGQFIWTGIDYLGEPSPYAYTQYYGYPIAPEDIARSSYFGCCDLLALPKDRFWLYRSHWNQEAFTLHIVPDNWDFPARVGKKVPVFVYTSADEAELFVNGVSQGRRRKSTEMMPLPEGEDMHSYRSYVVLPKYRLMWNDVVYQPGEVKVVAYGKDGKVCGESSIRTAKSPSRVVLTPESPVLPASREEFVFVKVTLADDDNTPVTRDHRRISYRVDGPAEIISVGNSNPRGYDSFKDVASHPLRYGRGGLFIRRTGKGEVKLVASADGLRAAEVVFR